MGASGRPAVQYVPVTNGVPDFDHAVLYAVTADGTATVHIPFTFDQPTELQIWFYALAQIVTSQGWQAGAAATADYLHTAVLTSIAVMDGAGSIVPSFSISSTSGTHYDVNGVFSPIAIRVKPGDVVPTINPQSNGRIAVAILSSDAFDAPADIDRKTITFGKTGSEESLIACSDSGEDVNFDGRLDLVCSFSANKSGFSAGDSVAALHGRSNAGVPLRAFDKIRVNR
jgi:hypothetical protein